MERKEKEEGRKRGRKGMEGERDGDKIVEEEDKFEE